MVVLDFSTGCGKSGICLFFGNPAKSGSGHISGWMPVQLQYVHLITDKTNAADLSGGLYAILISFIWTIKITKFIAVPQIWSK